MQQNYERLIEKISKVSGVEKNEIERKIEDKKSKLSGMISKEGAAQIVAAELGVSFDQEQLKIDELIPGMKKVNTIGKILKISPIRTFQTKNGRESKVVNLQIADDSSNIKTVLWDTNHIDLIEKGEIQEGSIVEITNASMRDNELHVGSFSGIKLSDKSFQGLKIVTEKLYHEEKISEIKNGESVKLKAFIVQVFEPRSFLACSECGKKVDANENCKNHPSKQPEKKIILNMVIDDGTDTIRAVFFNEAAHSLGFTSNDPDSLDREKNQSQIENLLGKEMFFSGNIKVNNFFNNLEFIAEKTEDINIDGLLEKLEA